MSVPTTLYRLRDGSGALLYVGVAGNPGRRFEQHAGDKRWWCEVARADLEHYPTREAALLAERDAIRSERPRYNIAHTPAPVEDSVYVRALSLLFASSCPTCAAEGALLTPQDHDEGCPSRTGRLGFMMSGKDG